MKKCMALILLCVLPSSSASALDAWNLAQAGYSALGTPNTAVVEGDLAFVAAGASILVLDIADPEHPSFANVITSPGGARGLARYGNYLYVGEGTDGIRIYQMSASEPYLLFSGSAGSSQDARGMDVEGSYLYVADGFQGLKIFSLSNPTNPSLRSSTPVVDVAFYDVDVVGNLAYVMAVRSELDLFYPTLKVFDVTSPNAPNELASMEFPFQGAPGSVLVDGGIVYLGNGLGTVHVAAYVPPSTILPIDDIAAPAESLSLVGSTLFAAGYGELRTFDVIEPSSAQPLGSTPLKGYGGAFWTDGSMAVVPASQEGIVMLDVADPSAISRIGLATAARRVLDVEYDGSYIFLADHNMLILGSGSLYPLPLVGINETTINDWAVELGDADVVYAAGAGIRAIDVSDPANPQTISTINPPGQELDLCVRGSIAYSAQSTSGFAVTDFGDPGNPQSLGAFTVHRVDELTVHGDFAYCAGAGLIEAVDVSDPAMPFVTDSAAYTSYVGDMEVFYDHLYVAEGANGVRIFDVSTPGVLSEVGWIPAVDAVDDVDVDGVWAWVADGNFVRVYNVGDKSNPVEIAYHEAVGDVRTVQSVFQNQVALAGVFDAGLYLFWSGISTGAPAPLDDSIVMQVWPNPAHSHPTFSFELGWNDDVDLRVYDVAGRLVRSWERSVVAGQRSLIQWNGRDRTGVEVGNGVYYYRLQSSRGGRTGSVVLRR